MVEIVRSSAEIEDLLNEAIVRANEPTRYSGMTYEQGIQEILEYLTGRLDENPLED